MTVFWASVPSSELSPGDVLIDAHIGTSATPVVPLKSKTFKHGESAWSPSNWAPVDGRGHFLAVGSKTPVMVITHGCEIDKIGGPILVVPLFPFSVLSPQHQEVVRASERHAFLPLPELTGKLPESYADMRMISYIARKQVDGLTKVASADEAGLLKLHAKLLGFFTRIDLSGLPTQQTA